MSAGIFKGPLQGILRCRDLVTLYYGVPMVTIDVYTYPVFSNGVAVQLASNNPRRIGWTLLFENFDSANPGYFRICDNPDQVVSGQALEYTVGSNSTYTVERSFLTALDAVSLPIWMAVSNSNELAVSLRETLLSPPPLDELPQP